MDYRSQSQQLGMIPKKSINETINRLNFYLIPKQALNYCSLNFFEIKFQIKFSFFYSKRSCPYNTYDPYQVCKFE